MDNGKGGVDFTNNSKLNNIENFYGGDGDDTIWGGWTPTGPVLYKGGAGDDTIYGAHRVIGIFDMNRQTIVGGAGKDKIDLTFYEDYGP